MTRNILLSIAVLSLFTACYNKKNNDSTTTADTMPIQNLHVLVGTYTSPEGSKGVYVYRLDGQTGQCDSVGMVELSNPSYIVATDDGERVYAVSENGTDNSFVHSLTFDRRNGALTLDGSQPTQGAAPCFVDVDVAGRNVVTANYTGGSISVFQIDDDGSLLPISQLLNFDGSGPDADRQAQPHLHSVRFSPDGRYLFAADLGSDYIYRFASLNSVFKGQNSISETDMLAIEAPAGTGPRHFDFHPTGNFFYLLGELSGQIVVYDYNGGNLQQKQIIAADTIGARGSADIHVSPDGRFLYASNRLQADGIAIFAVDEADGTLSRVGYQLTGIHPRNFGITPDGRFVLVACRDSNKIQVFARNIETGTLTDTHNNIIIDRPVCVKFVPIDSEQ